MTKTLGLLQLLLVPSYIWEDLIMGFIVSLPRLNGKTNILNVIDRLTKKAHFIGLSSLKLALLVVNAFSKNNVKLHGLPRSIVSDKTTYSSVASRKIYSARRTHTSIAASLTISSDN